MALLGILVGFVLIDLALYAMVEQKSTKSTFINDKFSKMKHYKLNNTEQKDIVFVGSSRTFFHIATHIFAAKGLDIYNFGISGAQFEDYPTIIKEITSTKPLPKRVVISINISRLYDTLEVSHLPTLEEARYYHDIDTSLALQALLQWGINLHQFLVHSQTIYYKIQSLYQKFAPHTSRTNKKESLTKNYDQEVGCHVFDIQKIAGKYLTLKCTNGDGIRIGNHPFEEDMNTTKLTKINPKSIAYIQKMLHELKRHNIPVTLLLQPILHNPYTYDIQEVKNHFKDTQIIDLTKKVFADKLWADSGHFNNQGRIQYSQYLSAMMQP